MLLRGELFLTVKCNYSTINLYHLLTYLAKPEQNGGSGGAFQKCPGHTWVCEAVPCLHLARSQESPVSGEAEAKQCVERRWMLSYRELFFFFFLCLLLVFLLTSVLRSKAFWWDWQTTFFFFFLWERRKRNPVSYFAQLFTMPAMLIEFAPVVKLKWMLIIVLDTLLASALWKLPPSSESSAFRALHQAASSKQSSCLPLFLLCQSQESHLLVLWSRHCASEKLPKYEVTTLLVFLWYFLSAGKGMCCTYLAEGRQELRFSSCALHCLSSLSFYTASSRACKWWRTGTDRHPFCLSMQKLIYWLIPS